MRHRLRSAPLTSHLCHYCAVYGVLCALCFPPHTLDAVLSMFATWSTPLASLLNDLSSASHYHFIYPPSRFAFLRHISTLASVRSPSYSVTITFLRVPSYSVTTCLRASRFSFVPIEQPARICRDRSRAATKDFALRRSLLRCSPQISGTRLEPKNAHRGNTNWSARPLLHRALRSC